MSEMIETKASRMKNKLKSVEVIRYTEPKHNATKLKSLNETKAKTEQKEIDMKRARYEVYKFGINGFKGEQKKKATIDILVELGAKPPKSFPINYRRLKEKRLQEKKQEEEQKKTIALDRTKKKSVSTRTPNRKKQNILEHYGTTKDPTQNKRRRRSKKN